MTTSLPTKVMICHAEIVRLGSPNAKQVSASVFSIPKQACLAVMQVRNDRFEAASASSDNI
jgi:hypothetical protein